MGRYADVRATFQKKKHLDLASMYGNLGFEGAQCFELNAKPLNPKPRHSEPESRRSLDSWGECEVCRMMFGPHNSEFDAAEGGGAGVPAIDLTWHP